MVVGGRKPVVRKKVTVGASGYGAEPLPDGGNPAWEKGKKRRFKLSPPFILMMILAPIIGLGGVAWLLKTEYFTQAAKHEHYLTEVKNVRESLAKQQGDAFESPIKLPSVIIELDTGLKCIDLLKEIAACETVDDLLKYVRMPDETGAEIRAYYEKRDSLPIGDRLVVSSKMTISYDDEDRIAILYAKNQQGEPWWSIFQDGFDLRLTTVELKDGVTEDDYVLALPSLGYNLVNIVQVGKNSRLHIRIFDESGRVVLDKQEGDLDPDALSALKKKLDPFPAPASLSTAKRWELVQDVSAMTGFEIGEADRVPKLDWKTFVRYSGQDPFEFLDKQSDEPTEFRALAMIDDYFNFDFLSYNEWICVRIFDPEESYSFFGYAKKQSPLGLQILEIVPSKFIEVKPGVTGTLGANPTDVHGMHQILGSMPGFRKPNAQVTLRVAFPRPVRGSNQVEILELVRASWYVP